MEDENLIDPDIKKIIDILIAIGNKINSDTDVAWTHFDNAKQLQDNLSNEIKKLQSANYEDLGQIYLWFLPTGAFQELSISNGWGEEYIEWAEAFDRALEKFRAT
ncbi:hypothetical protein [Mucilaginibacter sp.]|jgi:hypothetical protein|uniref:hypothetical protein n=1 Tax=Mucilaginibacter sp. TaxID=1882438 RepID=UPI002BE795E8|nr:hypothetical protein [Mucilaginibacter sp.]HTI58879.1 hypothetical protein [Mucilaginibacter sp.]